MREIKFRAWDNKNDEMLTVEVIDWGNDGWASGPTETKGVWTAPLSTLVLMQYTGLRDKNGKEIFEGDVVRFKTREQGDTADGYVTVEVVRFNHGGFVAGSELSDWFSPQGSNHIERRNYHTERHHVTPAYYYEQYDFEVIGDIYSNPELLKT